MLAAPHIEIAYAGSITNKIFPRMALIFFERKCGRGSPYSDFVF
jgi:hypothetical protein